LSYNGLSVQNDLLKWIEILYSALGTKLD